MKNDLVSIIVPSFKGQGVIKRCLESIHAQTYEQIEVIVVDDNGLGTENQIQTEKIVKDVNWGQVSYVPHIINSNGSVARNTGLRQAKGKYVCFFDDDDCYTTDAIEKMVQSISGTGEKIGFVGCSVKKVFPSGFEQIYKAKNTNEILHNYLLDKVMICSSSILIKKKAIMDIGGWDESFKRHQDIETITRLLCKFDAAFISDVGVIKFEEQRNTPTNASTIKQQGEFLIHKIEPFLENKLSSRQILSIRSYYNIKWAKCFFINKEYSEYMKCLIDSKRPMKCLYLTAKYYISCKVKALKI